jgi:hypothetical protein
MNKTITYRLALASLLSLIAACTEQAKGPDPRKEILEKHDQLMAKSEQAVSIKMQLDTLKLSHFFTGHLITDTLAASKEITRLKHLLSEADNKMEDWMHNYQPEYKGKSLEETKAYFKTEADKLNSLDSDYKNAIAAPNELFAKLHIQTTPAKK